jgi:DNA-binding response OmpR family regulator
VRLLAEVLGSLADETFTEVLSMGPFSALLVCADAVPLAVAHKSLEAYGMTVKIVPTAEAAEKLIKTCKFDLGIFDHDIPDALDFAVSRSNSANPKMVFAMLRGDHLNDVRGKRVHFVLQKPFTTDLFVRSLRAAYGTMIRDRRVAFRHPVEIKPAKAILIGEGGNQALNATVMDMSQGGLCINAMEILPQNATVQIDFALPGSQEIIHVTGTVVWTRASGRTGVSFSHIPPEEQKLLSSWLDSKLPFDPQSFHRAITPPSRQERMPEMEM